MHETCLRAGDVLRVPVFEETVVSAQSRQEIDRGGGQDDTCHRNHKYERHRIGKEQAAGNNHWRARNEKEASYERDADEGAKDPGTPAFNSRRHGFRREEIRLPQPQYAHDRCAEQPEKRGEASHAFETAHARFSAVALADV